MAIQSNLAGVARVSYEAVGVSEFVQDSHQAERAYRASTEHMSDGAIKLELANERLRRSLAKGPGAANQQARALLGVRRAEAELAGETTRTTATIDRQDRAIGRLGRSSHGALGGLTRLRGGAIGLTASLLGGAGLAYALRSTLDAAKESELVLGQTKLAVEAAGLSYEAYADRIETAIRAQSRLGFDDEKLLKTFSVFVTRTKDVNEALRLNALATDVARGRYIDLEAAQQIVLKASLGQSGALRRLGIDVEKGASGYELLAKLSESYGGRAAGAAGTATAAQDRLNVSLENAKEIIGSGLTPVVASLADRVSDYLDDAGRQEELQRNVNTVVKDGTAIIRGLARGLRGVRSAVEPVVDGLGGLEKVAQLAVAAFAVSKLVKIAAAIRLIGTASAVSAGQVGLLAAAQARAAGTAAALGGAGGAFLGAGVTGLAAYGVGAAGAGVAQRDPQKLVEKDGRFFLDYGNNTLISISAEQAESFRRSKALRDGEVTGAGSNRGRNDRGTSSGDPRNQRPSGATGGSGGTKGDGLSRLQRLQLASSAADTPREELAAARNEEAYFREIASNEKLRGDKLFQARSDLLAAQSRRRSIEDQIAADRLADVEKAASKREAQERKQEAAQAAAQRKRLAAAKRLRAAEEKISAEISRVNTKTRANLVYDPETGFFESTKPKASKAGSGSGSGEGLSPAEVARQVRDTLASLNGVIGQFGSNLSSGNLGQLETHAYAQTDLQRKQLEALDRLGAGMWFPGSGYSSTQLGAAGIGAGY